LGAASSVVFNQAYLSQMLITHWHVNAWVL